MCYHCNCTIAPRGDNDPKPTAENTGQLMRKKHQIKAKHCAQLIDSTGKREMRKIKGVNTLGVGRVFAIATKIRIQTKDGTLSERPTDHASTEAGMRK